jgi:HAD superfamily hydrolase (TIGR01509 family)
VPDDPRDDPLDDLVDDLHDVHELPASMVFDFDGTMVDTETAEFEAVRLVFAEFGLELAPDRWVAAAVHAWGQIDWTDELHLATEGAIDRHEARRRKHAFSAELDAATVLRPGLMTLLDEALARSIPMGVASNSPSSWIESNLERLGIAQYFHAVVTIDRVERGKPHPDPYLAAVALLDAPATRSVAFEDSEAGSRSAAAAGLFVIAAPGPMTAAHDLTAAHLQIDGFDGFTLLEVTRALSGARSHPPGS